MRDWHQAIEVSIAGKRLPEADQILISRAMTTFGAVSSVHIYCIAGRLAHLRLFGPVSGPDEGKNVIVSFDRGRVTYVR